MAAAYAAVLHYRIPMTPIHWVAIFLVIWAMAFLIMRKRLITFGLTWFLSYALGSVLANMLA
jgi:hypothetical protein